MIVALTGATGFVGGAVLNRLLADGHAVRALARRAHAGRPGVKWIAGSLEDRAALAMLCTGAHAVIHVAGVVNAPDRAAFDTGNVAGTSAMVEAAQAAGIARFVHVSSLSAREPGLSNYGASKALAEAVVAASGLDWTMVRPAIIYGPGELLDLFRMAALGFVMLPPRGRVSVIGVDDLARLLVALTVTDEGTGHIYEPDDGAANGWDHRDFARALGDAVGRRIVPIAAPRCALRLAAAIDGIVRGPRAALTPDRVSYMCHPDWVADPAKRPPTALWTPQTATAAGLAATADWYRGKGWLKSKAK